jgi:hypothetical protein
MARIEQAMEFEGGKTATVIYEVDDDGAESGDFRVSLVIKIAGQEFVAGVLSPDGFKPKILPPDVANAVSNWICLEDWDGFPVMHTMSDG